MPATVSTVKPFPKRTTATIDYDNTTNYVTTT